MTGISSRALAIAALILCVSAARADWEVPSAAVPACPREGDVVTVFSARRELWLCEQGAPVMKFRVALGRGGVDKRREGDGRTPVGTYTLGTPRSSKRFGVFIPIEYPTPDQAAQGFTGGSLGIHGPPRGFVDAEYAITADDWTRGCVATGRDDDIELIAQFVRQYQPILVVQ